MLQITNASLVPVIIIISPNDFGVGITKFQPLQFQVQGTKDVTVVVLYNHIIVGKIPIGEKIDDLIQKGERNQNVLRQAASPFQLSSHSIMSLAIRSSIMDFRF